jgi:hypothetical protein
MDIGNVLHDKGNKQRHPHYVFEKDNFKEGLKELLEFT